MAFRGMRISRQRSLHGENSVICVSSAVVALKSNVTYLMLSERSQKEVFELAGEEFNLGSPKQLQTIFYEKLELPILKKTKTF